MRRWKMQNRRLIIIGIILAVVLGLLISNYVGLFGEDYGTGLNINTETRKYEIYGHYNAKGKKIFYTDPSWEQLDSNVYIVSWMPDENSMKIITTAKFYLAGHNRGLPFPFQDIFFGQYAWVVQYIDTNNQWHTIINGRNNWIDTNYVTIIQGEISGNIPGKRYYANDYVSGNVFGDNTWTSVQSPIDEWRWEHLQTSTLSFVIKGNKIGAIRVYCVLEFAEMNGNPYFGGKAHAGELLASEDWAYLAPGIGRVDVLGVNSVRQDGITRTIPTNREVPLYVFEEGSTVVFSVDTGYAGAVTGQKGWRLAVYKSDQTQPLVVWWLDDDLRNYHIEWTIPKGTWTPGGENELTVVLTNTVIDQAERTFFVVDNISKIPGTTRVLIDKYEYNQGEEVHVTLRAQANPNGTGEISQFRVQVKWDRPDSTDYILNKYIPAYHIQGLTYEASFRFTVNRPDRKFYILAWAVDSEGRKGGEGRAEGYVKQTYGNYKITVFVKEPDGTPISNAKVTIGQITQYTGDNGKSIFYLQKGDYQMTVSKAGYSTYRGSVYVNADKTITITISSVIQPPEGWIFYLIIAVVVAIAVYIGVVIYKKYR